MNSKIHFIIIQSSILAFTLITAGIPILCESVLAQNDELLGQQQTNDTGLSQEGALEGSSTDTGNTDTGNTDTGNTDSGTSTDSGGSSGSE